jgi:hypothetical protein
MFGKETNVRLEKAMREFERPSALYQDLKTDRPAFGVTGKERNLNPCLFS